MELLGQYAHRDSEEAFAALVRRHVNLVYSVALRKTGDAHAAEEITQAVFIVLAKKARGLRGGTILSGWLYQTARLTAANFLRTELRRAHREQEAYVQSLSNETESEFWTQIAPLLDDALGHLSEKDRNAVVLRFLEGKTFQEIGLAVGASDNAAKKRVSYALEKLRRFFAKHGVTSTTAVIGEAVSACSVHAAPLALANSVNAVAVSKGATASSAILTLVKGVLQLMAWKTTKTVIVAGACALLAAGTATMWYLHHKDPTVRGKRMIAKYVATPIDLTAYYTLRYTLPASNLDTNSFSAMNTLPWGFQVFGNAPLQIGGMICLWGEKMAARKANFPEEVIGIEVKRKFEALYVCHTSYFPSPSKTPVCKVVFRYEDDSSVTNELLYGDDALDWLVKGGKMGKGGEDAVATGPTSPNSRLAWVGGSFYPNKKRPLRVCLTAIENPRPKLEVSSVDLYSCKSSTTACIMAMTTGRSGLLGERGGVKNKN